MPVRMPGPTTSGARRSSFSQVRSKIGRSGGTTQEMIASETVRPLDARQLEQSAQRGGALVRGVLAVRADAPVVQRACSPSKTPSTTCVLPMSMRKQHERAHLAPRRSVTSPARIRSTGPPRGCDEQRSVFVQAVHRSDHLAGQPGSADADLLARHCERFAKALQDRRERARAHRVDLGLEPREQRLAEGHAIQRLAARDAQAGGDLAQLLGQLVLGRGSRSRRRRAPRTRTRAPSSWTGQLMPLVLRPSISTSLGHLISTRSARRQRLARAVSATATAAANTWRCMCSIGMLGAQQHREVQAAPAGREEAAPEPAAARGLAIGEHDQCRRARPRAPRRSANRFVESTSSWTSSTRAEPARARRSARGARDPFQRDVRGGRGVGEGADRDLVDAGARDRGDGVERHAAARLDARASRGTARRSSRSPRAAGCRRAASRRRPSSASRACSSDSTSQRMRRWREPRSRARVDRARAPPTAAMWLSLIRMPSKSAMRWLRPPPQRTAHFSSARQPGVVLRVSTISRARAARPPGRSGASAWRCRTSRCTKFSAVRSASRIPIARPAHAREHVAGDAPRRRRRRSASQLDAALREHLARDLEPARPRSRRAPRAAPRRARRARAAPRRSRRPGRCPRRARPRRASSQVARAGASVTVPWQDTRARELLRQLGLQARDLLADQPLAQLRNDLPDHRLDALAAPRSRPAPRASRTLPRRPSRASARAARSRSPRSSARRARRQRCDRAGARWARSGGSGPRSAWAPASRSSGGSGSGASRAAPRRRPGRARASRSSGSSLVGRVGRASSAWRRRRGALARATGANSRLVERGGGVGRERLRERLGVVERLGLDLRLGRRRTARSRRVRDSASVTRSVAEQVGQRRRSRRQRRVEARRAVARVRIEEARLAVERVGERRVGLERVPRRARCERGGRREHRLRAERRRALAEDLRLVRRRDPVGSSKSRSPNEKSGRAAASARGSAARPSRAGGSARPSRSGANRRVESGAGASSPCAVELGFELGAAQRRIVARLELGLGFPERRRAGRAASGSPDGAVALRVAGSA